MYPVTLFGFILLIATVIYVLRPEPVRARLVISLGIVTLLAGMLGTCVGICNSAHFIPQVPHPEQLEILALGVEESLHNVVFSMLLVIPATLLAMIGVVRGGARKGLTAQPKPGDG